MKVTIQPSLISGNIHAPASKSSMQRACAAALVRAGESVIHNPGSSNDDKAALSIVKEMGCEWRIENGKLTIDSIKSIIHAPFTTNHSAFTAIDCGESGLSIRMFTPIVALCNQLITINGTGSLLTRPMDFFDEILPQLSVQINSNQGKLPLQVRGPLTPTDIAIDGSLSSQFLTGLLMAFAACNTNATITVNNLKSKPYVDLTLAVMKQFGLNVPINNNYTSFVFSQSTIPPINKLLEQSIHYTVEGDWSGGAFLLVAGAVASKTGISIKGLDVQSTQADKKILEALKDCGCIMSIRDNEIEVTNPPLGLGAFQFNATDCPDLFPPLVALAAYCNGTSVIEGVSRLAHKESNRGLTLQDEFAKMGIEIVLQDDLMLVKGGFAVKGATVSSRHDHRIAMACAVAALQANGTTEIEDADAINKSYPNFYEHLKKLNAIVQ